MRKRLSLFIAILLIAGVAFAAIPGNRQNPGTGDILGQGKYDSDAHKIFRMVRYVQPVHDAAATLAADSIVIWDLTDDDGVTVTTTTTSSDSAVAGILATQALTQDTDGNTAVQDRGKDNWTWLQTYGLSQVDVGAVIGVVTTAGNAMGTSTVAGEAAQFVSSTSDPQAQGNAGFFYDTAAAAANNVECFIRLD